MPRIRIQNPTLRRLELGSPKKRGMVIKPKSTLPACYVDIYRSEIEQANSDPESTPLWHIAMQILAHRIKKYDPEDELLLRELMHEYTNDLLAICYTTGQETQSVKDALITIIARPRNSKDMKIPHNMYDIPWTLWDES